MEAYCLYENNIMIGIYMIDRLSLKLKKTPSEIMDAIWNKDGIIDKTYRVEIKKPTRSSKNPMCEQMKSMCFAYSNGFCTALEKTDFDYDCPFFKTDRKGKR